MYLKCHQRKKDVKLHRYWSVAEHVTGAAGRRFERHVLYLGEISDAQRLSWERRIRVFDEASGETRQMWLLPADRPDGAEEPDSVQAVLSGFKLCRPRQWGACWLFCRLWEELRLDAFWEPLLPASRKGTRWLDVLKVLAANRLIAPSSEWRMHREWFDRSAIDKLAGIQMMDVKFPTTDGRSLVFARHTEPEPDQQLILDALGWKLPSQAPPRITAKGTLEQP